MNEREMEEVAKKYEGMSQNEMIKGIIEYGRALNDDAKQLSLIRYLLREDNDELSQRVVQLDIKSSKKGKSSSSVAAKDTGASKAAEESDMVVVGDEMEIDSAAESLVDVIPPSRGGLARVYARVQMGLMLATAINKVDILVEHVRSSSHMFKSLCISYLAKALSTGETSNIKLLKTIIDQSPSSIKYAFVWACSRETNATEIVDNHVESLISSITYAADMRAAMILHGSSNACVKKYLKRLFLGVDHPDVVAETTAAEKEKLQLRSQSKQSTQASGYIRWPLIWKNHKGVLLDMMRADLEKCEESGDLLQRAFVWAKWNPAIKFSCKIHHSHPKPISSYDKNSYVPWEDLIRLYFEYIPYYPSELALRTRNYAEIRDLSSAGVFKNVAKIKILIDAKDNGSRNAVSKVERRLVMWNSSIVPTEWVRTIITSSQFLSFDTILSLTKIIAIDMGIDLEPYGKSPARFVHDSEQLFDHLMTGIANQILKEKRLPKSAYKEMMDIAKAYIQKLSAVTFYASIDKDNEFNKLSLEAASCVQAYKLIDQFIRNNLTYLEADRIFEVLDILKGMDERFQPTYELFKLSDESLLVPKPSSFYEVNDEDKDVFGEDTDPIPPTPVSLATNIIGPRRYAKMCKSFYDWAHNAYHNTMFMFKNRCFAVIQSRQYGKSKNGRQLSEEAYKKTFESEKLLEQYGSRVLKNHILRIRSNLEKCITVSSPVFGLDPIKTFRELNIDSDALSHEPNGTYPFKCFDDYSLEVREKLFYEAGYQRFFEPPGSLKANRFQKLRDWLSESFRNNVQRSIGTGIWQRKSTLEFLDKVITMADAATKNDPSTLSIATQKKNKLVQEYNGGLGLLSTLESCLEGLVRSVSQMYVDTEIMKIDRAFAANVFSERDSYIIDQTFQLPLVPIEKESILIIFDLYCRCAFRYYNLLNSNSALPSVPIQDDYYISHIEKALRACLMLPVDIYPKRAEDLALLYAKHIVAASRSADKSKSSGGEMSKYNARTVTIESSLSKLQGLLPKELWFKIANTLLEDQDLPMIAIDHLIPHADIRNKSLRRRFEKKLNRKDDESRIKYLMDFYRATLTSYSCVEYEQTLRFIAERIKNEKFENQKSIISQMFASDVVQTYLLPILIPHADTSATKDLSLARVSCFTSKEYGVSSEDDVLRCSAVIPQLILQIFEDHINLPDAPFSSSSSEKEREEGEAFLSSSRKKTYSSTDLEGINALTNLAKNLHLRCLLWRPVPQSQGKTYSIQSTYFNFGFELQYRWYKHQAPEIDVSGWSSISDWYLQVSGLSSRIPAYNITKLPVDKKVIEFETRCVSLLYDAYQSKSLLDFDVNKVNEKARLQITSFSGVMARLKGFIQVAPSSWDSQEKIVSMIDKLFQTIVSDWSLLNPSTTSSQIKKKRKNETVQPTSSSSPAAADDGSSNLDDQTLEYWAAIDSLSKQTTTEQIARFQRFNSIHSFFSVEMQNLSTQLSSVRSLLLKNNTPNTSNFSGAISSSNRKKKTPAMPKAPTRGRGGRRGGRSARTPRLKTSGPKDAVGYSSNLKQLLAVSEALPITTKYLDWIIENFGLHHPALGQSSSSKLLTSWIRLKLNYYGLSGESRRLISFMKPKENKAERHPAKRSTVFKLLSLSKSAIHLKLVQSYLLRFHQDKLKEFFEPEDRSSSAFLGKFSMIRPEVVENADGSKSLSIPGSAHFRFPGYYGFRKVAPSIAYSLAVRILDDVCNSSLSLQLRTQAMKRFSVLPCVSFIDLLELYSRHLSLHNAEEEQKRIDEEERQKKALSLINDGDQMQIDTPAEGAEESENANIAAADDDNDNEDQEDDDDDDDGMEEDEDDERLPQTIPEVIEKRLHQSLPVAVAETLLRGIMIGDDPLGPVSFLLSPNMIAMNTARETIKVVQHATHYLDPAHIVRLIRALFSQSARGNSGNRMPVGVHKMLCNMLLSLTNDANVASEAQELLVTEWYRGKGGPGAMHRDIQITILVGAMTALSEGRPQEWAWKILSTISNEFDRTAAVMMVLLVADPTVLVRSYDTKIYVDPNRREMYLDNNPGVLKLSREYLKAPLDELVKNIEAVGAITIHQNHHEGYKMLLLKTYNSLLSHVEALKVNLEDIRKEFDIAYANQAKISSNTEVTKEEKAIRVYYSKTKIKFENCKEKLNTFTDFSALTLISLIRWCGRHGTTTDEDVFLVYQNELFTTSNDHIHPNFSSDAKARIQLYLDLVPKHLSLLASDWYLKGYNPTKVLGIKEIVKRLLDIIFKASLTQPLMFSSYIRKLTVLRDNLTSYERLESDVKLVDIEDDKVKKGIDGTPIKGLKDRVYTVPFQSEVELLKAQRTALSSF